MSDIDLTRHGAEYVDPDPEPCPMGCAELANCWWLLPGILFCKSNGAVVKYGKNYPGPNCPYLKGECEGGACKVEWGK